TPNSVILSSLHYWFRAFREGALVDVSRQASEARFMVAVAVTKALWEDIKAVPAPYAGLQTSEGRLWDVLNTARAALQQDKRGRTELRYNLAPPVEDRTLHTVKLIWGRRMWVSRS